MSASNSIQIDVDGGQITGSANLAKGVVEVTVRGRTIESFALGYNFDVHPVLDDAYWLIGGIMPRTSDNVRLVVSGEVIEAEVGYRSWLAAIRSEGIAGREVEVEYRRGDTISIADRYRHLERFFRTTFSYGPLEQ